tara:strand:+ start:240 stop:869 length:630 start_codon:yes stop_codon:yes gene_type:complete
MDKNMKLENYNDIQLNFKLSPSSHEPGFHGDINLIELADELLKKSDKFIETGTNMGNTLFFASRNYDIECHSCEIHGNTPRTILDHKSINFQQTSSPEFLYELGMTDNICTFWLDAHSGVGQTIHLEELKFILKEYKKYYIFVDDVNVEIDGWTHNNYFMDDIKKLLGEGDKMYIPNYTELDNPFHGKTGWSLITNLDFDTKNNIKKVK